MLSEILTRQTAKPARIDRAERFRNIPETTEPVAGYKAERTAILEMKKEYGDDMAQVAELNREWKDSDIKKWCDEWDRCTGAVAQIDAGLRWLEDLTDEPLTLFHTQRMTANGKTFATSLVQRWVTERTGVALPHTWSNSTAGRCTR